MKHTTNLDAANFITIDNRGANPTNGAGFTSNVSVPGDAFTYDGKTVSHYSYSWVSDSWNSGAPTSWLSSYGGIKLFTAGSPRISINNTGRVGIGTTNPTSKLDIVVPSGTGADTDAAVNIQDGAISQQRLKIGVNSVSDYAYLQSTLSGTGAKDIMLNPLGGNVGIGTVDTKGHTLAVAGDIIATKIMVKQQANWADYVFEPTYKLPSLQSVENFILFNRHLPDVPSAEKVAKDGINLGDNQAVLLKKIEELTLYLIEQNKKQESLQKEMEILKEKLEHAMGNTN